MGERRSFRRSAGRSSAGPLFRRPHRADAAHASASRLRQDDAADAPEWLIDPSGFIQLSRWVNLRVGDYTHFRMKAQAGPEVTFRAVRVFFLTVAPDGSKDGPPVTETLLPNAAAHGYSYSLKLLDVSPNERPVAIPVNSFAKAGPCRVTECSFLRGGFEVRSAGRR